MLDTMKVAREFYPYVVKFCKLGWPEDKACRHVVDGIIDKLTKAREEKRMEEKREQRRRELENPQEAIMQMARRYEKEGEPRVKLFSRLFRENPIVADHYERQVKGGDSHMMDAGKEIARKAAVYSKENSVDLKTATEKVIADNPELAWQWHYGKAPVKPSRRYQEEEDVPIMQDMRPGSPHQKLGALMSDAVANGDIQGALRAGNAYPFLVEQAFMEVMIRLGKVEAQGLPGPSSEAERIGRSMAARRYPDVNRAAATGRMNEAALRVGYPGWFKSAA